MNLDDLIKPGVVNFIVVRHDSWCPGVHGAGDRCICNPTLEAVDEETMVDSIVHTQNRAQRRAAARQARRKDNR
ncbi:MAG: hypothetical protein Q8M01_15845 [Rubrivivax sp.]|nr:hypothetical protein [Rubrivivax sp.]